MFLPFLLKAKGASLSVTGVSLSLLFFGGAAGKFICGWLGARAGVIRTVIATESATAACILAVLFSPLALALPLLPVLGLMLNGTSSVLYGTVPDLTPPHRTERAFALFYSGVLGSGAIAPILFGSLGDWLGTRDATSCDRPHGAGRSAIGHGSGTSPEDAPMKYLFEVHITGSYGRHAAAAP